MSPAQLLTEQAKTLSDSIDRWNRGYLILVFATVILAALTFIAQFVAMAKGKKLAILQGDLLRAKDMELATDLRDKDLKIADAQRGAEDAKTKAEGFRLDIAKAKESAAQAEARATEARLELARFRAPRVLNPEQQQRIASTLSRCDKAQRLDVTASPLTVETGRLAEDILSALRMVLPGSIPFPGGSNIGPMTGAGAVSEVVVFATTDKRSVEVARTLTGALNAEGIIASSSTSLRGCDGLNVKQDDPYCFMVLVVVGPKR